MTIASVFKRGFTLMEVNLAIFIMAVGVLGMVALYPLGFRESRQARDDVFEAAVADGILNPLAAALSDCSSNITWQAWKNIAGTGSEPIVPSQGWLDYCRDKEAYVPVSKNNAIAKCQTVLEKIRSAYRGEGNPVGEALNVINQSRMSCALVLSAGELPTWDATGGAYAGYMVDHSRLILCLRVSRNPNQLFEQPAFYTEVRYQNDPGITSAEGVK